jgi:hypothetical protein
MLGLFGARFSEPFRPATAFYDSIAFDELWSEVAPAD